MAVAVARALSFVLVALVRVMGCAELLPFLSATFLEPFEAVQLRAREMLLADALSPPIESHL
jgi:hypothetical protein